MTPPLIKREDRVLLMGQGCFAGDAPLTNPLFVSFARGDSVGALDGVEYEDALGLPGVAAVYTAADTKGFGDLAVNPILPISHLPRYEIFVDAFVRYVGQPLAAVLANTQAAALDGAEAIYADVDDGRQAPRHQIAAQDWQSGDVEAAFARADHVVACEIVHPRLAPAPMEPRAISVAYDADADRVTIWHSTQTPHRTRAGLAEILGIDAKKIRVIATHVGGAFGMKASLYPEEVLTVWAAFQLKRDVCWQATRSEDFLSAIHGRGLRSRGELALDRDGHFLGLLAEVEAPMGPWLPNSALVSAWNGARILPSGYRISDVSLSTKAVQDGLGPIGIYRGAGRPEANMLMERLIDKAARVTGIDPLDLRRKNMVRAEDMPHALPSGDRLCSGDYPAALTRLADTSGYDALLKERDDRRAKGELIGIGTGFYVEPSGSGWESARVTLEKSGRVTVASGSSSQGHSRETAYAVIAAEALALSPDDIDVVLADTDLVPEGIGAVASRATAIGGSAVLKACQEVRARYEAKEDLPITVELRYENEGQAWGFGAYLAMVSICRDTGTPTIEKILCVDDAGRLIVPELVKGQIAGGFAQGLGEAMMEAVHHDGEGQLLTGSFMDYAMPRADTVPPLEIHTSETHSPTNLLGAKGVGEAGPIGAPPALMNAVIDALAPLGVTDLQMPLTSHRIWQAMKDVER